LRLSRRSHLVCCGTEALIAQTINKQAAYTSYEATKGVQQYKFLCIGGSGDNDLNQPDAENCSTGGKEKSHLPFKSMTLEWATPRESDSMDTQEKSLGLNVIRL